MSSYGRYFRTETVEDLLYDALWSNYMGNKEEGVRTLTLIARRMEPSKEETLEGLKNGRHNH